MLLALVLLALVAAGYAARLHALAATLRDQVAHAWSIAVADLLLRGATPHRLALTSLAIGLDGALSFFEGWFMHRRYWWAPWLVVMASGLLVPFELARLAIRFTGGRLAIVVTNAAIVVYLVGRARREHPGLRRWGWAAGDGRRRDKLH